MKKPVLCLLAAALLVCPGCASNNTAASTANTPMTLDEALQKSAETRQKIQDAKKTYTNAKNAASSSSSPSSAANKITAEVAKAAVQSKVNDVKQKAEAEKNAWKQLLE